MAEKAIASMRTLFLVSLTIGALWLLSYSSITEKLDLHDDAVDVQAWVLLKERLNRLAAQMDDRALSADGIFEIDYRQPIDTVPLLDPGRSGRGPEEATWVDSSITISSTWPSDDVIRITLIPEFFHERWDERGTRVRIYRIETAATELPFADYWAVFFSAPYPGMVEEEHNPSIVGNRTTGFIDQATNGLRQLARISVDFDAPNSWHRVAHHLAEGGFDGPPWELKSRETALSALRQQADLRSPHVQFSGLPLDAALFFRCVGLLLAVTAFAMLGPLLALHAIEPRHVSSPWILVAPVGTTATRRILEAVVWIVTGAWSAFPLLIMYLQVRAAMNLPGIRGWPLWLGALGLVLATVVYGAASWRLRAYRTAHGQAGSHFNDH